ncbi:hypothetical protein ACFV4P_18875 [Kitasatospora sp. NPDC059795]|uniref:hypothetical protein n=1 Tax=Kitasatospora sp. NPDC059795 TaxID=3346949 RepID=UPI0036558507
MPSTPAPKDAQLGPIAAVRRRLTVTVHVDPAGRVLLYRRAAEASRHPGHYDLLTQRTPPEGQLAASGGLLVVRRVLTSRPPTPGPREADWYGFVPPAELLAGRCLPLVPGRTGILRRLLADLA